MNEEIPQYETRREILTPSSLNRLARDLIEDALPLVWIEGELSNVSRPASGHLYFTLKDSVAQVRCAMFKPRSTWLRFRPADGAHVLARARVSLYEARGEFQLLIEHMEEAGEGALRRAFELLKAKLQAEGLFDPQRKRALPRYPRRIGVITSATGAAIRDVLSVARRRCPLTEIEILPVPVQGREAPAAIVAMLKAASRSARHDVLLLTRGGGSLEDLIAFNDEGVARAVAASAVPVVCAVGHEVDFSIADFVADLRAPTPSAAAELLLPDSDALSRTLEQHRARLQHAWNRRAHATIQRLDHLHARLLGRAPQQRLASGRERLLALRARMQRCASVRLESADAHLRHLTARLRLAHPARRLPLLTRDANQLRRRLLATWAQAAQRDARRVAALARALQAVSPLNVLQRGYAILFAESGEVLRSAHDVGVGTLLTARLQDGELALIVREHEG
ncbi:MAG TPA: exodeoxyribonuclease VII large subunit [Rhodanobacteraceae bacterium]|nr:exodeoxyribonuclease VII large subunit [Rhodanobacteraceae bacterium]